ncbi:2-amino-4-hydroxy-6-hydroxymethyldihydropteridine diphosphokinase [Acidaminobacter sp.]|uniref:2-amino-4-hydroxy-6- hydroxymethyldihydropteridine diphosphokinase n=1 Tax=Acidaminobacter sp. TaxID=1872102 RepID=UPI0013834F59|nr:2-amino-4-hydroxy-6-hydroxymethyldihydropteridine diphosphokinase [Acidaminobacter sp.]MDK9710388.1 2-amino-4-hydroxy-6-hydroxymethyldihydropteridine diphosphokinase [Acidaminobacter sp.]MZQ97887.1 2-amino-4-hydroxy-6-hydroxymethyldihydropteridine diphosphokinase [Acidaminobacter sp.]
MARAYLGLGSNLGDKVENLREAVRLIGEGPQTQVVAKSSLYATAPVGYLDQDDFVNGVIEIETGLTPEALLALCQSVEQSLRRVRLIRWGPRTIDVDVLLYQGVVSSDPVLTLPHPRMHERAFVLVPLAELDAGLEVSGKTVEAWLVGLEAGDIQRLEEIL